MTHREEMKNRIEIFFRLLLTQSVEEFSNLYTFLITRNQGSTTRIDSSTLKKIFAPETEAAEPKQHRTWKTKHKAERLEWLKVNPKARFKEYADRWGLCKKIFYKDKWELGQRRRRTKKCQKKKSST